MGYWPFLWCTLTISLAPRMWAAPSPHPSLRSSYRFRPEAGGYSALRTAPEFLFWSAGSIFRIQTARQIADTRESDRHVRDFEVYPRRRCESADRKTVRMCYPRARRQRHHPARHLAVFDGYRYADQAGLNKKRLARLQGAASLFRALRGRLKREWGADRATRRREVLRVAVKSGFDSSRLAAPCLQLKLPVRAACQSRR